MFLIGEVCGASRKASSNNEPTEVSRYKYCVDLDLEKFFDTVSHSKLIQLLGETIKDGRVISLIHRYLNAGVMVGHKYEDTTVGVPQGRPLSPILSNIMLTYVKRKGSLVRSS